MRRGFGLALVAALMTGGFAPDVRAQVDPKDAANLPAELEPLAATSLLLDLGMAGKRMVAVGERGHVLLSDDQGAIWRQAKSVPTRAMLTAVYFVDADYGWAVGHDETILKTTDGGETWARTHFAPEAQQPLLDLWFANRVSGIAVGAYGAYFTTNDGGRTWSGAKFSPAPRPAAEAGKSATPAPSDESAFAEDELPPDYHLNRIVGVGNRLYIAAEGGQLYRSDDRGANWRALPSPYEGSFFGLVPIRGDGLLAFGLRGNLFKSADAGGSWTKLETGTTAMLTDGYAINDLRVVIGGLTGVLLVSGDAGETFRLTQQDDRKGVSALLPGPAGTVVVAGEGGVRTIRLDEAKAGS
ncbi:MAG TPA: YCF48-related protein [Steroidobacteraceae bacterium]|nr:YCF48-related protein [Steroidobacteraceae bacterium]